MGLRRNLVRVLALAPLLVSTGCQAWLTRASIDTSASNPNGPSYVGDISSDGRYLVFESQASDLVAGDGTAGFGGSDVFRRDLSTGTTVRASVDTGGGDPDGPSFGASISADGRFVAFFSRATDLVSGDTNGGADVFLRDMQLGTTLLASVGTTGFMPPVWEFINPSISGDGDTIAFEAIVRDDGVFPPEPPFAEVFVRDVAALSTTLVSAHTGTEAGVSTNQLPDVSGDGRHVVFTSDAGDLVAGDGNGFGDVFSRDVLTGTTTRVSVAADGGDADGFSGAAVISANGQYVGFSSVATDLVPGGLTATFEEIYIRDLTSNTTSHVSVDLGGGPSNGFNVVSSIGAAGRHVAWWSSASDLTPGDNNGTRDVFVRDRQLGETLRVSLDSRGGQTDAGASQTPRLTADGRFVAFGSYASDLVEGDDGPPQLESSADVFVRAVRRPVVTQVMPAGLARGTTTSVTLTGKGFGPGATVTPAPVNGVTVNSVTVVSDTTLTVSMTVAPSAAVGARDLTVAVPGLGPGVVSTSEGRCSGCFSVT